MDECGIAYFRPCGGVIVIAVRTHFGFNVYGTHLRSAASYVLSIQTVIRRLHLARALSSQPSMRVFVFIFSFLLAR